MTVEEHRKYAEIQLQKWNEQHLIDSFQINQESKDEWKISIECNNNKFMLLTDFEKTMELTINNYFREVTDYLIGDFKDTIDWYLEIVYKICTKEYTLVQYERNHKPVSRSVVIQSRSGTVVLGDRQPHLKILTKKVEIPGGNLK